MHCPRNNYLVFWKSPSAPEKGTVWLWCSDEMRDFARLRHHDEGVPFRARTYRPSLLVARGIKWTATWEDGTTHTFKASPQFTKPLMAQLAQRWTVPPITLQRDKGRPFDLVSLLEESHSHVYLVQLTFDPTADGRAYYKIGKAVSIPKRIKQFGPCQLVAEARLASEKESLKVEAHLHQRFAPWRKPETEIFCFSTDQLEAVVSAMAEAGVV
jgi:hypothetical protein